MDALSASMRRSSQGVAEVMSYKDFEPGGRNVARREAQRRRRPSPAPNGGSREKQRLEKEHCKQDARFTLRLVSAGPAPRGSKRGSSAERLAEEPARVGFHAGRNLLGDSGGEHAASQVAPLGAEIDDVVGGLDNVEVVLDDDHRVPHVP